MFVSVYPSYKTFYPGGIKYGCTQFIYQTKCTLLVRKQARKHVRDARDFNNIETRAVIKIFFFSARQGAVKEIHATLTETLAYFLPGRAKDLSAPLYKH